MPATSTAESPPRPVARPPHHDTQNWLQPDRDKDTILVAGLLAVIAHLLLFWLVPTVLVIPDVEKVPVAKTNRLEFKLVPDLDDPIDLQNYVMSNPDAPDQVPAETNNMSERNQVAAQPDPAVDLSPDHSPMNTGDMEESNRLVQGDPNQLSQPSRSQAQADQVNPEADEVQPQEPVENAPAMAQSSPAPAPFIPPIEGLPPEDLADEGLNMATIPPMPPSQEMLPPAETVPDRPTTQAATAQAAATSATSQRIPNDSPPRPRPTVQRDTTTGPLKSSREGVLMSGPVAFNAKYSQFGDYFAQVKEAVYNRWVSLIVPSKSVNQTFGATRVVVSFAITRDGEIVDLKVDEATAGPLEQTFAVDAIESPAPYRKWTPEMILMGEDKMECTVTFYY